MGHFCPPTRLTRDIINYFYNATLSSMIFYISVAKNSRLWNVFISHRVPGARTLVNSESSRANASRSLNGRWKFLRDDGASQRKTIAVLGATWHNKRSTMERVQCNAASTRPPFYNSHMPFKEFLLPPTFFVLSDNVNRMKHFSFLFSGTTRTNTHFPSHMFLRLRETKRHSSLFVAANEQENRYSFSVSSSASTQALLG